METDMLNINDMLSLQAIVEMATAAGIFRADQLAAVGTTYNKLVAVNKLLVEKAKEEQEQVKSSSSTE